ncbi:MAG: tetratricopeptide repeat protein [Nodosilinea sp.]
MELVVWLAVVLIILGGGMGWMVWAYRRPAGHLVVFATPIGALSSPMADAARKRFEGGAEAFQGGRFAQAIDQFSQVIETEPGCAEAFHNCGLAYANLGNDGLAVRALVKASEYYDQQGTKAGVDLVKQHLEQLAEQRRRLKLAQSVT